MIRIRKIIFLILCLTLVSCTEKAPENPFTDEKSVTGAFFRDGREYCVTVLKSADTVTVIPKNPEGYSIVFSKDGARVCFDGTDIEIDARQSVFYPLYEMANGISTQITENKVNHSDGYIFK